MGDIAQGGYVATLTGWNEQCEYPAYRAMTLYNRNFSATTWEGTERVAMTGFIEPQVFTVSRTASTQTVALYSYHKAFESVGVTGCYFTDSAPGTPHDLNTNATLADVVNHLATVHISISGGFTTDIDSESESTVFGAGYIVKESRSLWSALQAVASDEFYVLYWTRQNQLVYKQHPQFRVAGAPDSVATLNSSNLLAPYVITVRTERKPRNVVLLGLTSAGAVLESTYPAGVAVDVRGKKFEIRCETQVRLDVLAQRQYEWLVRDYDVTVQLAGAWDFELYDHTLLTLAGTATNGMEISWVGKSFYVSRVTYRKSTVFGYVTELALDEGFV